MWRIIPIAGSLFWVGPATAVYGIIIVIRRKVRLTRTRMLHGKQAVVAGLVTILWGVAFFVFQVYWTLAHYPRDW